MRPFQLKWNPPKRKKKEEKEQEQWNLDTPLLSWNAAQPPWRIRDACEGTLIEGVSGSGKTSGALQTSTCAMLRAGFGGLFLTSKVEDARVYAEWVRRCNRADDLRIFSPDSLIRYNFIADEARHSAADGVGLAENLTALLMTVSELLERGSGGGGDGSTKYFRSEAQRLCNNALSTMLLAGVTITVPALHRFIVSAPMDPTQVKSRGWQDGSFCFHGLSAADAADKSPSQRADFELALSYFLFEWPGLSSKTRSVIQSTLTSVTDMLSRGAARDMLSSPTPNISPSDMYDGAIVIADFPVLLYRDVGQLIQVILKFMWQRAHARRDITTNQRPTFIVADEAQMLLVDADQHFQAISRSTRTAVVYATQSHSGLLDAFGPHSEAMVHTLLANLQTKICHQQTDARTIQYYQELVGKLPISMMSGSRPLESDWMAPIFGQGHGASAGLAQSMDFELQASDFNSLAKGGPPFYRTEAIVYQGGRMFSDGRTWLRTSFDQRGA